MFQTHFKPINEISLCRHWFNKFCLGRVNLIGEHTDYNNGFVFPMALPLVTVILGKQNNTDMVNVISITMNDRISFSGKRF